MSTLLIVGAGGHGSVVADAALTTGRWDSICFLDDRPEAGEVLGFKVIGTSNDLEQLVHDYRTAAVGIGNAAVRLELLNRCQEAGFELPSIIHRSASVSSFAAVGAGTVVFAQAAVNARAALGVGCIVNTGATVDHDCSLAAGVHVCPGANLAGGVRVGARAWIGIGSCIKQGVSIGPDVTVGAGASVISDVEAGLTVLGVPARASGNRT